MESMVWRHCKILGGSETVHQTDGVIHLKHKNKKIWFCNGIRLRDVKVNLKLSLVS